MDEDPKNQKVAWIAVVAFILLAVVAFVWALTDSFG
jgi:hypothetical protein